MVNRRGVERPTVDAIKLAHHGSRDNVNDELLDLVDARQVIVSTDGKFFFGHPDDEAIARVVRARLGRVPVHRSDWWLCSGRGRSKSLQ